MIANIANLSLWEWFKLRRRWMLWVLLIFAILFAQLAVWGQFFSYRNLQSTGGELTVPASLQQQQGRAPRTVACNDLLSGGLGDDSYYVTVGDQVADDGGIDTVYFTGGGFWRLSPDIETIFMTPSEQEMFISASLVKQVARLGGDVSGFVHPQVAAALAGKMR